jgi:hypothetical protein
MDNLSGEQHAIGVFISALIGETRQKLTYQTVLASVDLNTITPGTDCETSGFTETLNHRHNVVVFHPLWNFT